MNCFVIRPLLGLLFLASTAAASIIATPSAVVPGGVATVLPVQFAIHNPTGGPLTATGVSPFAISSISAVGSTVGTLPTLVSGVPTANGVVPNAVAPFQLSLLPPNNLSSFSIVGSGVSIPAGGSATFGTANLFIPADFLGTIAFNAGDASVFDFTFTNNSDPSGVVAALSHTGGVGANGGILLTVSAVPEPSSFMLLGLVGVGLVSANRFRKTKALAA